MNSNLKKITNNQIGGMILSLAITSTLILTALTILNYKHFIFQLEEKLDIKLESTEEKNINEIYLNIKGQMSNYGKCRELLLNQNMANNSQIRMDPTSGTRRISGFQNIPILNTTYVFVGQQFSVDDKDFIIQNIKISNPLYLTPSYPPYNFQRRRLVFQFSKTSEPTKILYTKSILFTISEPVAPGGSIENCSIPGSKEDICLNVGGQRLHCNTPEDIDKKITVFTLVAGCSAWYRETEVQLGVGNVPGCPNRDFCCDPQNPHSFASHTFGLINWPNSGTP